MAQDNKQDGPPRPTPQPAWTIDARAGAACQGEVIQALERLLGLLQTGSEPPPSAALAAVNRRFGRQLSPVLQASADMLQGCGAPFQYLPFGASTLRQLEVRIRVLQNSKASLDQASAALGDELNACRVQAAACVDAALRTLRATLDNPGSPPPLTRPLLQASLPLRELLEARARDAAPSLEGSHDPSRTLSSEGQAAAGRRKRRPPAR